jgi:type I site-specific restriction-modification system R (restriction) subunit
MSLYESHLEEATLRWFAELEYSTAQAEDIAPEGPRAERESFGDVLLVQRFRDAIDRLNPTIPQDTRDDAFRKVARPDRPTLIANNQAFHAMLRDGVEVEYMGDGGMLRGDRVALLDYDDPDNNDWLAVNQFTVIEGQHKRRPDVVVFVNGLPLAVIELKNPADEDATIWTAFNQLQTYKQQIPSLFAYNELMVASDGLQARIGSLTANQEWFKPWRTVEGDAEAARWKSWFAGLSTGRGCSSCCGTSSSSSTTRTTTELLKSSPATTSSTPRSGPLRRRSKRPARRGTSGPAWSGTRRGRARASRCCFMRAKSSCIRRWRTRRWCC